MRVHDRNNFNAAKFVFFKMSDESEHSDSDFYYPGELSDAELLQLHTSPEITERKSTFLTYEEVQKSGHVIKCCARSVRPDLEPNIFPSGPTSLSQ